MVIFKKYHRSDDNKGFDELLGRYRSDVWTKDDIKTINLRIIDASTGVMSPNNDDVDVSYSCPFNKERNCIAIITFQDI